MDDIDFKAMKRWQWWVAVVFVVAPWISILFFVGAACWFFDWLSDTSRWISKKIANLIDRLYTRQSKFEDWLVKFAKGE